jgi:hypothetical protein
MLLIVFTAIDDVFNALFFGSGSWLGLLLFLMLIVGLAMTKREMGVVMFPVSLLIGIAYLENDLGWHALAMFISCAVVAFIVLENKKND